MDTNKNDAHNLNHEQEQNQNQEQNMETNQPPTPDNSLENSEPAENNKNQDILPNPAVQGSNPDKQQKLHNWKNILILILMLIAFILGFQFLMSFMVIV